MQTVIHVITTGRGSLRSQIMRDPQLEKKFGFIKVWEKQPGRPPGWGKIHHRRLYRLSVSAPSEPHFHYSYYAAAAAEQRMSWRTFALIAERDTSGERQNPEVRTCGCLSRIQKKADRHFRV